MQSNHLQNKTKNVDFKKAPQSEGQQQQNHKIFTFRKGKKKSNKNTIDYYNI